MTDFVENALLIVKKRIPSSFLFDPIFDIPDRPTLVVEFLYMRLEGQSKMGTKSVNMTSSGLHWALKDLARRGPGHKQNIGGVIWQFVARELVLLGFFYVQGECC